jgi:hypothetical protein
MPQWEVAPFRGLQPPGLHIRWSVDRLDTCVIESYMENPAFTRVCLSYVRFSMVIVHVPLVEQLCQAVMG